MVFRIADTFTRSLASLTGEEQKLVKTTAFELQMNPANPGHQLHKLDNARDKHFWSVRVSRDIRIILHRTDAGMLLCYADHHDAAYRWAERRKIEAHPRTGAAQIVEIRESVREIIVPVYKPEEVVERALDGFVREDLLAFGVPDDWVDDLLSAGEDHLLEIAERLPEEASEAVLSMAVGRRPLPPAPPAPESDPFEHPDALRRFRVMDNREELERALEAPWDEWAVFLHPAQKALAEGCFNGPVRVSGSAGTGKTIVALHRTVYLAERNPEARILLTTFSESLAESLRTRLRILLHKRPRLKDRIEVRSLDEYARVLHRRLFGSVETIEDEETAVIISRVLKEHPECRFSEAFLLTEWNEVIDQHGIASWDEYRETRRLGRRRRLSEDQRKTIWSIGEEVNRIIGERGKTTLPSLYFELEHHFRKSGSSPFDFIIVDEAQDISIPALRFLASLYEPDSETLFFSGDLGQRIFQQPFSWKSLGVDIQGRSHVLKVNYRTSHQIRTIADRLLEPIIRDADGNAVERKATVSVFNGARPVIELLEDLGAEIRFVSDWLSDQVTSGVRPEEIGVIVRSERELPRALEALKESGLPFSTPADGYPPLEKSVVVTTMHLAKGLEFKSAAVMACDDEIVPNLRRIEEVGDEYGIEEVHNTERHLLYVACTRARDQLLVAGTAPGSEFLEDMDLRGRRG